MNEKKEFQKLLHDLCLGVGELPPIERKGPQGRKPIPLPDAVFSAVYKIYSTFSARRFTCDLQDAKERGYITRAPHFNSVLNYLENPALFSILVSMIQRASLPLQSIEENFAVDSTGFAFSRFVRWYDIKYNKFTAEQQWIKLHFCTGVKTNVITAVKIEGRDAGDAPQLPALVQKTAENFTMKEVSADKGYTGRECHDAIAAVGATPFIMFKANATGAVGGLFQKMFHYFQFKKEDFRFIRRKRSLWLKKRGHGCLLWSYQASERRQAHVHESFVSRLGCTRLH
ncbi:MAG TPA: transposase, partial [Tepidisphaeraceae bacterium]|nr:transposase [Tepidisphaeraceae bacterium]